MSPEYKSGYVSIVGRPNVGKSTLLNQLIEQKISITSKKRQTTRHNIVGVYTDTAKKHQIIYVDTPGIHQGQDSAINRYMNRTAASALQDVDAVVFVVDKNIWTNEDQNVADLLANVRLPVILAVNKVDQLDSINELLPHIQAISEKLPQAEIMPLSALKRTNLDPLRDLLVGLLPESESYIYPEDQVTDRSTRFLASEIVREKVVRLTGDELPYQTTVAIEEFTDKGDIIHISALVLVEREGQKRIVIGDGGERIKQIGIDSRRDLENMLDCQVMLKIWVKVKTGWSDNDHALRSLGFDN